MLGLQSLFGVRFAWALGIVAAIGLGLSPAAARSTQESDPQLQISEGFSLLGSYLAGRVASRDKNLEAAAEYYRRALTRDPDNADMLGEAFKAELGAGNMREAVRLARRLTAAGGSEYGFAYLLLGTDAFKRGDYAEAERLFRTVGDSPIIQLTDRLALAWTQFARGRKAQAIDTLSVTQSADRSQYFQHMHMALASDLAGRPDDARDLFERAFERHNTNRRLIQAYARHAAVRGDDALVKEILGPYQSGDGADRGLRALYAELRGTDEPELLVTNAREGLAEVYFGIGAVLSSEQAAAVSRFYLQLALYLRPEFNRAYYLLGEIETRDQRLEAGLEAYRSVAASSALYLDARIRGAFILNALERSDEGIGMLTAMVADYPEEPRLLQAIGNILRDEEEYAQAARYYDQAIQIIGEPDPEHWLYYYARGICYERMKVWDKAEVDLQKALELNPDQASVMNYLGYSWVDQNMHLEKAMDLIREAVRREPNNGYYVDSLGWAYYRLGQFEKAVKQLEKAVELRPEDPILNDHLGDAYWKVGRKREARFQWSHALSLDPEPEDRKEILDKLANGLQDDVNKKAELGEAGAANMQ
ncbi:tetratricopeptide repeat protein [Dichotomicrobium thermohalophilum]|uniref:Tetratricopeptide repeat protein n=1 Tax=Dichotomicrobium thermohalophilum TaxID=933063 RepID=A0A397QCB3_9HYPH|nr:tetratricopeptide repeat protein [Dichotomicrobium thermohalophilum]RIA55891.1 tetratricopeptide repeat protein [Dichotomicrobium thermohalophilum]